MQKIEERFLKKKRLACEIGTWWNACCFSSIVSSRHCGNGRWVGLSLQLAESDPNMCFLTASAGPQSPGFTVLLAQKNVQELLHKQHILYFKLWRTQESATDAAAQLQV